MNFSFGGALMGSHRTSSRATSPASRSARLPTDDGSVRTDKAYRRYATTIEKTLATWEISPEEWADYIAFLSRLLRAIQTGAAGQTTLPHSNGVASKLAQCLNPSLPSGVHSKALEVYAYIFATFGKEHVSHSLHEYLPGLFPLLSFAALSVRPALYDILEDYVVCLQPAQLRPVLKSFILSIFPALEDETSEDFDRALTTITRLEHAFLRQSDDGDLASFYWQSVFLSVITSPTRRQGALNYLVRRLPKFTRKSPSTEARDFQGDDSLSPEAEAAITPEPGLLIRAFACGLSDTQTLIQRGFLDMLTTHLPLDSVLLQHRIEKKDFQLLLSATMGVLLRRDMSLNRRVWQWFLGPEETDSTEQATAARQLRYITNYGIEGIETCLLSALSADVDRPSERVKPFRIGLSLMDRWEIGGSIVPKVFLPTMDCAFRYSQKATASEMSDFLKSASLFVDGVESKLIWSNLYLLLASEDDCTNNIRLLLWILKTFNVKEEEMALIHAPMLALYALDGCVSDEALRSSDRYSQWQDVVTALVGIISVTAITGAEDTSNGVDMEITPTSAETQGAVRQYYDDSSNDTKDSAPFSSITLRKLLVARALEILTTAMAAGETEKVTTAAHIVVQLLQKFPQVHDTALRELLASIEAYAAHAIADIPFDSLNACMMLMSAIASLPQAVNEDTHAAFARLEAHLSPVLLAHVSPQKPKFNVEAVRLLWRLDALLEEECAFQASVQALVTDSNTSTRQDSIRTFLNLWNLSFSQQSAPMKSPMPGLTRRVSSHAVSDHDRTYTRMQVLSGPLLTALDTLAEPTDVAFNDVDIWLNSSIHTESALLIVFEQLHDAMNTERTQTTTHDSKRGVRRRRDGSRALVYVLQHFDNILRHAQSTFWAVLVSTQLPTHLYNGSATALTGLVDRCLALISNDDVHFLAISILDQILSAPQFVRSAIRVPHVGTTVSEKLLLCVSSDRPQTQTSLLKLAAKALVWQQSTPQPATMPARASKHARKMSLIALPPDAPDEEAEGQSVPVQLLVQLIKSGFSSSNCHPYLDSWLQFAESVLPMIGSSVSSVLIPITEVICAQVENVFQALVSISATSMTSTVFAPEPTIAKLLDGLEMILRGGHSILLQDDTNEEASHSENGTVLSNMTPNLFKSQGHPSKTSKANNRLTAILASKDIVRVCMKMWLWTSTEGADTDRQSAATTSYSALRLRNRARHMLEGVFSLEPLESLEVVAAQWVSSKGQTQKDTVISLLHVLRELRPRNTVPAILDALCSRTNPAILVPDRQSTLTTELASADLVLFYSAYLASLEDDALEEVWSDCMAFLRDVLSNPLPYRQILPALIWIIFQIAQKLENTNYGERKRMRRELGDNFQRLLAATFAALPHGSTELDSESREQETPLASGLQGMNLVVILREVIGRAEIILESSDRVAACINTVSTNLITPSLRSKSFPAKVNADILSLTLRVAKKSPGAKTWRKDVADAFNDPRFIMASPKSVRSYWFPVLQQWSMTDKERMAEIVARLYAPSSAGIMFGVGANAARLDADRKTQMNLRRIALLLLAAPTDSHIEHLGVILEKMVELFEASATSSPSSAVKAELFMLLRALQLSTSAIHFAPIWPILNDNLQTALLALDAESHQAVAQNNLSLLQACKLLDLLAAVSPDDFQLYEWIYLTNTTDAVYHQPDWRPYALSDSLGELPTGLAAEDELEKKTLTISQVDDMRAPLLVGGAGYDTEDVKAMAQDTFVNTALRPYLSQLSIISYESRYRMDRSDMSAFISDLVKDLQDISTVVS